MSNALDCLIYALVLGLVVGLVSGILEMVTGWSLWLLVPVVGVGSVLLGPAVLTACDAVEQWLRRLRRRDPSHGPATGISSTERTRTAPADQHQTSQQSRLDVPAAEDQVDAGQ